MSDIKSDRSLSSAFWRGLACRCPECGKGSVFEGYIKVKHTCNNCGLELYHQRADDAPPYFTMMIVLHFVVPGLLALEKAYSPETWVHMAIWIPVSLIASLILLPRIKSVLIGIQWARRMHGFDEEATGYSAQQID